MRDRWSVWRWCWTFRRHTMSAGRNECKGHLEGREHTHFYLLGKFDQVCNTHFRAGIPQKYVWSHGVMLVRGVMFPGRDGARRLTLGVEFPEVPKGKTGGRMRGPVQNVSVLLGTEQDAH